MEAAAVNSLSALIPGLWTTTNERVSSRHSGHAAHPLNPPRKSTSGSRKNDPVLLTTRQTTSGVITHRFIEYFIEFEAGEGLSFVWRSIGEKLVKIIVSFTLLPSALGLDQSKETGCM